MFEQAALYIPIENQVRELDAKLLLACVAAARGYSSVIGPRVELHSKIAMFPRGVYIAKDLAARSAVLYKIVYNSGHKIVSWDEEALVHLPPEIYASRRLSPVTLKYISHLLAWGEDNAELWRQYSALPSGKPIHVTGNPRADLLRKDLSPFFENEANQIRQKYGEFILINTNFNHVNAFHAYKNLFQPVRKSGVEPKFGEAGQGMTREYAEGLHHLKQSLLEQFKALIPALEKAFPEFTVILRPHPSEKQETYRKVADQCKRIVVTNEGNVVPWLMSAMALIHNGCTTGVEAYLLGVPAISYRPTINEYYDLGFYRLPNTLSHQCYNFTELTDTLHGIFTGQLTLDAAETKKKMVDRHLTSQNGPLACDRIVDVVSKIIEEPSSFRKMSVLSQSQRWSLAKGLALRSRLAPYLPLWNEELSFRRHRYPGISLAEVRSRICRFQQLLGLSKPPLVEPLVDGLYKIHP